MAKYSQLIYKGFWGSPERKSMQTLIDGEFNEIVKPKKKDVAQFYKLYRELFYDIPQEGDKSEDDFVTESISMLGEFVPMSMVFSTPPAIATA